MIYRAPAKIILLFLTAYMVVLCFSGKGLAETNLPRPFAPWMSISHNPLYQHFDGATGSHVLSASSPRFAKAKSSPTVPAISPADTLAFITAAELERVQPSPIEKAYAGRIVDELSQFGYDLFGLPEARDGNTAENIYAMPAGAVQDDFLLNIGDRLEITFRGQREDSDTFTINSQGQIIISGLPPITAAGRPIGEVRALLEAHTEKLYNTDVYLALDAVRQVNVTIIGAVEKPGRQTLTVFHTLLDALMAAGGIKKDGTLRQIKLVRQGRSSYIDLYGLLIHGSAVMDLSLRDGDRIIVPPVGPTVAIAGSVNRPGIYEILPSLDGFRHKARETGQPLSLEEMLALSGGVLNAGQNRFIRLGLSGNGSEVVQEIHQSMSPVFNNGSILMVAPSDEIRTGMVELAGHTRQVGLHALDEAPNLSNLLSSSDIFGPDIYSLIGVIERRDEDQLSKYFLSFPPLLVYKGRYDRPLQDGDVIHLFSRSQILALQSSQPMQAIPVAYGSSDETGETGITDPALISFLAERSAFIRGAVRNPGMFPVAEGISLKSVIAVAGGLTLEAATDNIEVTSRAPGNGQETPGSDSVNRTNLDLIYTNAAATLIEPGDSIRVNQKFRRVADNSVLIIGEVSQPGRYDLLPGDTMADLLARASGLTPQAYADGAIFSRESERRAEEARFKAQARELEIKLAAALQQKDEPDVTEIAAVQELITQLKQAEAVGRITVEADPAMLTTQPELNILLQSGDRIYIPKRPLTVRVAGEVLSAASLQFRKDKNPRDYIMEAGGFTYHADKDRAFVVYPDGSAQPLLVNTWNHTATLIPPGSTIVVPRDPKPFDFIQTAKDVSQILSNLAITGIFVDDIRNGD